MAPSTEAVFDFLRQLARVARPAAQREFAELEQFAGRKLNAWDVGYYAEKLQHEAVLDLAGRAAAVLSAAARARRAVRGGRETVRREDRRAQGVPVWHADARFFEIHDASGKPRAGFYLDACARAEETRRRLDGRLRRAARISAASTPAGGVPGLQFPAGRAPASPPLLTHDDVVTMFHEFGHGLHHMLTRVGYPSIAGINGVSWDAVELPSQFMENFAWRPEVLAPMARHFETGAPLPADKQAQLLGSRTFQAGPRDHAPARVRAVRFPPARRVRPGAGRARRRRSSPRCAPRSACSRCRSGTASRTTSRTSSRAAMPRATTATSGPRCSRPTRSPPSRSTACSTAHVAQRFLDSILSQGGSRKALDAFVDFRGRPPDVNALLRQQGSADERRHHGGGASPDEEFSIATWNVNSLRVRGEQLMQWLADASPTSLRCRKPRCRTRISRIRSSPRPATTACSAARRPTTAWRCCRACR